LNDARRRVAWLATLLAAAALPAAEPRAVHAHSIVISDAWARPTAAGMPMGVAYFVVRNDGAVPDAIVAASTPAAARVEFHRTTLAGGVARMRPLAEIAVPARSRVMVEPGGIHLMLVDLAAPLVAGARVPLVLVFRNAGKVEVSVVVESRTG
jgi:periplasmic copper chaperone A